MNENVNRNFKGVWIPKKIWLDNNLTWMEKLFITEINSLDNDYGCYASNNYFANFFNLTASRCSQIINKLIEKKYLSVTYEKKGKEITKRTIKILNTGIKNIKEGIKKTKGGYLENDEGINTFFNNTLNNTKNKKTEPSFSQEILNITQYLYDNITNKPTSWIKKPPDLNKWAADIDKLNRIDGVPPEVIQKVIGYAMTDKFWQSIVQSGSGLRRNFNKIEMQMKANDYKKEPEETMKERLERIDRGDIRYNYKPGEETMKERLERIDRGDIRYD